MLRGCVILVSRKDKLLEKLRAKPAPTDFSWRELVRLMAGFGYIVKNQGGSKRVFFNKSTGRLLSLHEPHPAKVIKQYCIKDVVKHLVEIGAIDE